jgi:3-deoxy-D-manno-octulosonate 8-phosphate phosphatase (KDO 8-P phosphatase)
VGFSCAPANASDYIKNICHMVTMKKGGDGAFREFVEEILERSGQMKHVLGLFNL